ncbi:MAG: amidohydrolase family protein, partial [Ferruginibacter sp.]|nr:amidohydrolase family protein [Ferruginibacter sp.]
MSSKEKIIYGERCWVDGKIQPATITMENDIITKIEFYKSENAEDVGNSIIMPGVIDAHVHINEPGRADWEGFNTATKAAAAGGSTTIVDMPLNSSPVTSSVRALNEKVDASNQQMHVNCGFYGGLIPGNEKELKRLIEGGVLGIKCFLVDSGIDEFPNVTKENLEKAMPILASYNIPLLG